MVTVHPKKMLFICLNTLFMRGVSKKKMQTPQMQTPIQTEPKIGNQSSEFIYFNFVNLTFT